VGGPTSREPAVAAVAATVVLVRDGPQGLETLMVVRHHEIDFARGAAVFPGGKLSASDSDPRIAGRVRGCQLPGEQQFALRVAAVRETFEESGLLLARHRRHHGRRHAARRPAPALAGAGGRGGNAFVDMVCEEDLELALEQLVPYAHWVTPEVSPKRFDTHFFIAAAPPGQVAQHDGSEAVDSFWIRPADALDDCAQRRRTIIFPTLCNLALLAQTGDVAGAVQAARSRPAAAHPADAGQARRRQADPGAGTGLRLSRTEPGPDEPGRPLTPTHKARPMEILGIGLHFEDLPLGRQFRTVGRTVTETDIVNFCTCTGMTEVLFTDLEFLRTESDIKGRVAPGALAYTFAEGLLVHATMQHTGFAFLEMDLKVHNPVFAGDTLHVECEVIEARLSKSRPGRGLVRTRNRIVKHDGTLAITYTPMRMIKCRNKAAD
jgi:acyl dehydratase/8-oxo-dGTP pyrophosphatase MutT (NUDIX family)